MSTTSAIASDADKPLQLAYVEGDVAGMTSILDEGGKNAIGFIEYRQHRRGETLEISRIAHFNDGSSDEDQVEALVGKTLRAVGGRIIIRNTKGTPTVDIKIDIGAGRITGFSGLGKEREEYDETKKLSPATYWGPLLGIVLKNFDKNAVDGRLSFHTIVPTPKPRVFDMEFTRKEAASISRAGGSIKAVKFGLVPDINFLIDPIIKMFTPATRFYMQQGHPPAMARFDGPRNYAGQIIRIE
ncbi:MAG: hypothetical protein ABR587_15660 [Candidatus Binatia bacterium]